ncbi:MAG TPA: glycosyltransferase family 4 protein [Thermoanaerobaculia bacterium]|nr:glycosyltransferase family 4 protein [Thermoanaerobaculia bacterium]
MKAVFLLNGAALYGGVKVVFQHARALRRLGVDAEVLSPDPPPVWFPAEECGYRQVGALVPDEIGRADVAIGTIWFTVPAALDVDGARAFHLCQCYEPLYEGVADRRGEIEAVYRLPTRKLAVSPHLVELLRQRHGFAADWIPQPFEPELFVPPRVERPADGRLRVLVAGPWEVPIKGIEWGLRALRPLAEEGWLDLVRLALEADPQEVALWPDAERRLAVPPSAVPPIHAAVDAYVGLCDEVEGFGLPALEAMGCARPCVLTDIGAVRALDPLGEAALRVPHGDGDALRAAVRRLRDDVALRRRLGAAGRRIAERFTEERSARALLAVFTDELGHRCAHPGGGGGSAGAGRSAC